MLLPSVDPTGKYLIYWSGRVAFNSESGLWEAEQGDLYFESWSRLSLQPVEPGQLAAAVSLDSQGAGQLLPLGLGPGTVQRWIVRWDAQGRNVALWVGDPGSTESGRVTLFRVDQAAGRLETESVLLSAAALSNVAFDESSLVYTMPDKDGRGQTYIVPIPEPSPTPTPTPMPTPTPTPTPSASPSPSPKPDLTTAPPGRAAAQSARAARQSPRTA